MFPIDLTNRMTRTGAVGQRYIDLMAARDDAFYHP